MKRFFVDAMPVTIADHVPPYLRLKTLKHGAGLEAQRQVLALWL